VRCTKQGVAGILRWLFWRLKSAFPGVKIILRADAGFSLPEILRVCERSQVGYAIGFTRNAVTERKMADLLERARLQFVQTQQKARLFDDVYYAAGTWDAPRRLVMKAEWLLKGAAKVTVSARRVLVDLARHSPFAAAIRQILSRLQGHKIVDLY
jgi:Transposase DDE domain group 1